MFSLSRIGEVFQQLPRGAFDKLVEELDAQRYAKRFGAWDHLVAMLYAHLGNMASLREVEAGFNQHKNHHHHLGTGPIRRTTLADANARRDPKIFAELVKLLMAQAGRGLLGRKRQEMLYLLDSTSVPLRGRGSEWTLATATRTPGLKMHVLFASRQEMPVYVDISAANVNDVEAARKLPIERGATYVFDKGYCDYGWWSRIEAQGARFVTRLKKNAAVKLVRKRELAHHQDASNILGDEDVKFAYRSNRGQHRNLYDGVLRTVTIHREHEQPLVLVTNDLTADASEIALLYKERWQIELFFKWIKQRLKIKKFFGESEKAVRTQLLTGLIAYLLVLLTKAANGCTKTLKAVLDEIRANPFQRRATEESLWRKRRREQAQQATAQGALFT